MKEAQIFENWINNLSEGTWALPETPEQMEKLNQLMSGELIVGPDATNATEQLYDIVGDDELFDILNDLADRSEGRANIWDDSDVQRRLAELGIQTPQSTETAPADVPQDTAPPVAEGELDEQVMGGQMNMFKTFSNNVANGQDAKQAALAVAKDYGMKPEQVMFDLASFGKQSPQWIDTPELQNAVKTLQQLAAANRAFDPQIEESNELAEGFGDTITRGIRRAANAIIPGAEKDAGDYGAGKWDKNTNTSRNNLIDWITVNQLDVYEDELLGYFDKFVDGGGSEYKAGEQAVNTWKARMKRDGESVRKPDELAEMLKYAGVPIREGVLTDSTGSTLEHIKDTFKRDIKDFSQSGEMSEHLFRRLYDYYFDDMPYGAKTGDDIDPYQWVGDRFAEDLGIKENLISPMIMPVSEGSCNMTAEGSYCPEHGLMECGSMYEDGGAVGMPYSMGEDAFPTVNISGLGYDDANLAGEKFVNPIQPRKHNALSPLTPGDSRSHPPVAHVDLTSSPYKMEEDVDDPINYNAAMTGSYYEGKETDIQEGDALLARIKSLALLR